MAAKRDTRKKRTAQTFSKNQLAVMYALAPQTVRDRLDARGVKPTETVKRGAVEERRYSVEDVHPALSSRLAWGDSPARSGAQRGPAHAAEVFDLNAERARHEKHKADKEEILVDTLRGDRVLRDEIQESLLAGAAVMRQAMEAIPGRLAEPVARFCNADSGMIRGLLLTEVRGIERDIASEYARLAEHYITGVGDDSAGAGGPVDSGQAQTPGPMG